MTITARDIMTTNIQTVHPDMPLTELERSFMDKKVRGFPVVEHGKLVGIVSRTDIIRQLVVEQSLAEMVSDYYRADTGFESNAGASLKGIGDQVGERMERLHVRDVMIQKLITVGPEQPVRTVAQTLIEHDIHRVLVSDGDGTMAGIITTGDLVRLIADGRIA